MLFVEHMLIHRVYVSQQVMKDFVVKLTQQLVFYLDPKSE
jgi:hypothetical protein